MMMRLLVILVFILQLSVQSLCYAQMHLDTVFPYSLTGTTNSDVFQGSTNPLYLNLENINSDKKNNIIVKIHIPKILKYEVGKSNWKIVENSDNSNEIVIENSWSLRKNYDKKFDLLFLKTGENAKIGKYKIKIETIYKNKKIIKHIDFNVLNNLLNEETNNLNIKEAIDDHKYKSSNNKSKSFNWYITRIVLPVDENGDVDNKIARGSIYIKDTSFEKLRNRIVGNGAVNWEELYNKPITYLAMSISNQKHDVRVLQFKAELVDKKTGNIQPGLCHVGMDDSNAAMSWGSNEENASTALISLKGERDQNFVIPLYVNNFKITEGKYNLRITVNDNANSKVQEIPIVIIKKSDLGIFAVGFSIICFIIMLFNVVKIKNRIKDIGAKGAITVALFSAVAFGSIVVPTNFAGEILSVILGPFSGLVTGLLSGVLLYMLITALLMLYRKPGIVALMFISKWLLTAILFGQFTPAGVLSYSVYIVVLELVFFIAGVYKKGELTVRDMIIIAISIGLADAFMTFINLEKMMFFYRLYYADWYIFLYMVVNGLVYSSIGTWFGFRLGNKLRQITGD